MAQYLVPAHHTFVQSVKKISRSVSPPPQVPRRPEPEPQPADGRGERVPSAVGCPEAAEIQEELFRVRGDGRGDARDLVRNRGGGGRAAAGGTTAGIRGALPGGRTAVQELAGRTAPACLSEHRAAGAAGAC